MFFYKKYRRAMERCADLECELSRYQATATKMQKDRVAVLREASTGYTSEEYAAKKDFKT